VHECLASCEAPGVNHSNWKMFRFQTQTARDASGAGIRGVLRRSPTWVNNGPDGSVTSLLVYPEQRTRRDRLGWSVQCQFQTPAPQRRTPQSIRSSAVARIVCGTVSPSALAVVRFISSSSLVGNSNGSSPAVAPLKILSTYTAERRQFSRRLTP
jgi:hypothetical protein